MDAEKYRRLFVDESRENLSDFQNQLIIYEKSEGAGQKDAIDAAFRAAHSLKGMAAAMGLEGFTQVAHRLEDIAQRGRRETLEANALDLLLKGADLLSSWIDEVESKGTCAEDAGGLISEIDALFPDDEAGPLQRSTFERPEQSTTFLVRFASDIPLPQVRAFMLLRELAKDDAFLGAEPSLDDVKTTGLAGSMLSVFTKSDVDEAAVINTIRSATGVEAVWKKEEEVLADEVSAPLAKTIRVRADLLDQLIDSVGELLLTRSRLRKHADQIESAELHALTDEVERVTRELHSNVVESRMTPLTHVTQRLPRVVRDLSRDSGKTLRLEIENDNIEIDRAILDVLFSPLLHLVRNAVDHAHCGDEQRQAQNKNSAMLLKLSAERTNERAVVTLEDDGEGISHQSIREKAVAAKIISASAAAELSESDAIALICEPGFSTRNVVTETSGRGVGLDAVASAIRALGGTLSIKTEEKVGTRFEMRLPLSVAILQVLVVEADSSVMAVPIHRVERAFDLEEGALSESRGERYLMLGDDMIPVKSLSEKLGFEASSTSGTAILVEGRAFLVDKIIGQEEVVAKPLGAPLNHLPHLSGATLLADGRAAYILEPQLL